MNDILAEKLNNLPDNPGCYLMKDAQGKIIYVGKAKNLKNRVRSYFKSPGMHNGKTALLVENIADFDTVIVNSEAEALILEANLIKEYTPYYNILMRDDKYYPYLCLTMTEDYPRLEVARRAKNDGNKYFGPYPGVGGMRQVIQIIKDIFPLRSCKMNSWPVGHRACLNAHIGRCKAPCEKKISKEEYAAMVNDVESFLLGKTHDLLAGMEKKMHAASKEMRFEDAAKLRDAVTAIKQVQTKQALDLSGIGGNHDIAALKATSDCAVVQLFFVRSGKVIGREHFFLTNAENAAHSLLMKRFLQEYYGGGQMLPPTIYVNVFPDDAELLSELFSAQAGRKVQIAVPYRGDKKRILGLVEENAELILTNHINSHEKQQEINALAVDDLRQVLKLNRLPARIECYDISHIQGTNMVGSMVVFINGAPAKQYYRRFKIKTLSGSNDFAALQEVLERRWQRGVTERQEQKKPLDFGNFPDLIVIDGGKGQLSSVLERLREIGAKDVDIISLAKQQEEIFLPGQSDSIILSRDSAALQLLQRIRDEAHRFAISYHRQLRKKDQVSSILDQAPQIGASRRRNLLQSFGSLKKIREASIEELAVVPGMNRKVAATLFEYLHSEQEKQS